MGFLFSSKKRKMIAVFDIGSGSVGGALVYLPYENGELPTIIKSTRVEIQERKELDFNIFLKDMISALNTTSSNLYQSRLGAPTEIFCVLASPWYVSETRLIKISKKYPFIFSTKIIDELLQKEISSLENIYKNRYDDAHSTLEVIEHPIVGVSLNGYSVQNPIGKKTNSAEISMLVSVAPKICLDNIKETLSRNFHHTPISFSSFMTSSYITVRDRYMDHDSYLLIDIGGEITDIGIVSNGVLKNFLSFPYGKKTLFRDFSNRFGIELRDAYELFSLFSRGDLSEKQKMKIIPILKSIEESWSKSFKDCVETLPSNITLPNVVFVTVDSDVKDWFLNIISSGKNLRSLMFNKEVISIPIDGPELLHMCDVKSETCDPFLMIESISVARKIELRKS